MKPGMTSFWFLDEVVRGEEDRLIRDALNQLVQASMSHRVKATNPTKSQNHQFSASVPVVMHWWLHQPMHG